MSYPIALSVMKVVGQSGNSLRSKCLSNIRARGAGEHRRCEEYMRGEREKALARKPPKLHLFSSSARTKNILLAEKATEE